MRFSPSVCLEMRRVLTSLLKVLEDLTPSSCSDWSQTLPLDYTAVLGTQQAANPLYLFVALQCYLMTWFKKKMVLFSGDGESVRGHGGSLPAPQFKCQWRQLLICVIVPHSCFLTNFFVCVSWNLCSASFLFPSKVLRVFLLHFEFRNCIHQ